MEKNEIQQHEQNQFEGLIEGLINNQYGCCDDFLTAETVAGLRNNIHGFNERGEMKSAGLGKEKNYQKDERVRGDNIKWIEQDSEDQFEMIFLKKVNQFINHLNSTCYTSITSFESHYANYGVNSFYKRHLDQFKNDNSRKFSIILYLNEDWQDADGGVLSLYPEGKAQKDFSPLGGRLMFFKSDEMEHEVHPSRTRDRKSIAGWFKS